MSRRLDTAREEWEAVGRTTDEAAILAAVRKIPEADYRRNTIAYRALTRLFPDNAHYREKRDHYAARLGAEESAATKRANNQRMGISWRYSEKVDDVSGGQIRSASVLSSNTLDFSFPYEGRQRARLGLRDHPRWGRTVWLEIERGQFACYFECYVQARFGDGKTRAFKVEVPESHDATVRFVSDDAAFVDALRRSDRLYLEASFFHQGTHTLTFETEGLRWN